jgi:hypothetical protein
LRALRERPEDGGEVKPEIYFYAGRGAFSWSCELCCALAEDHPARLTNRFPAIVEAASRLRAQSFLIDGEAVVCRDDGVSDFDALRSRRRDHDVSLIAFDLIELQGRRSAE